MSYTHLNDFEKEDGKVDWAAYDARKKANGETCYKCGGSIMFPKYGMRALCNNCDSLTRSGSVTHPRMIRCPHCGSEMGADPELGIFIEGEHKIWCNTCDNEFTISTTVSFTFESPERIKTPIVEDDNEEA